MTSIPQPAKALKLFYSYASKDDRWRRKLETHLSLLQREGFITGWHSQNITAGAVRTSELDAHLTTADIILLLISPDFLASEYCYSIEMKKALARHSTGEACVIPIILRPTDWMQAPFGDLQVLPSNTRPVSRWRNHDEALLDIVMGIRKTVYEINVRISATLSSEQARHTSTTILSLPIWTVPYRRNPLFTGREEILTHLHNTFTIDTPITSIQAISGLGGIGKTQIATEYAYRYRKEYTAILWAQADSREILTSDFVNIADSLNLPEKNAQDHNYIAQTVKRWLQTNTKWLFILDNVQDFTMIREYLPPEISGHILLTTRLRTSGRMAKRVEVGKMTPEEGALFLLRWTNIIAPEEALSNAPKEDQIKAVEIARMMDGLPLALDQAGAYIEETACSLSSYLDLYKRKNILLLKRSGQGDHPESVFATLLHSLDKIQSTDSAAAELLRLCAFLHPDAIPEEIIIEGAPELGPVLYPVTADPFQLNDTIGALLKFSLVQRDSGLNTITIHQLVQTVIKIGMDGTTQKLWAERAVRAVNRALPDFEQVEHQLYQRFLPHIQACTVLIDQWHMAFTEAAELLYQAGHSLQEHSQYTEAEPLYQRALEIYEKELGPDHPYVATSIENLANLCRDLGKYDQAKDLYQRALMLSEKTANYFSKAAILNNLAKLYQLQGKYDQAEQFYERALTQLEQTLGPEHPSVATVLESLIVLYYKQDKSQQAEQFYQRILGIYRQASRIEYADKETNLENFVELLQKVN